MSTEHSVLTTLTVGLALLVAEWFSSPTIFKIFVSLLGYVSLYKKFRINLSALIQLSDGYLTIHGVHFSGWAAYSL